MVPPKKKPSSTPVSSTQKSYGGGVGISIQQVQAVSQQHFLKRQQERAAQEQLYQQITRSTRPYTSAAMPQDGAIAYHAQALTRALIKRQAIDNGHARLVRQGQQQLAANKTYIKQGPTEAEKEIRRQNAIARKKVENIQAIMQSQPEATGIASGVIVGMAVSSQVVGSELILVKLVGATRLAGATRTAIALERVRQGLSYQVGSRSGVLTWQGAGRVAGTFAKRAVGDGMVQFGGGLVAHNWNMGEAYDEVNLTSAAMAGLPSDGMWHSLRNNVIGAGLELKLNRKELIVFQPLQLTQSGLLNFGQKVGIGLGTDYLSDALAGRFDQQAKDLLSTIRRTRNPFTWAHSSYMYIHISPLKAISTNSIKITGSASTNMIEEKINAVEK